MLDPAERARRSKIAKQKIAVRLEGSEVYQLIKRINLNLPDINKAFDCDAWYVKEEIAGDVIWPENWMTHMQPSTEQTPWRYVIVQRDYFPTFDQTRRKDAYDGDAVIWAENVPYECEAAGLVAWIAAGLEATLPSILKLVDK